MINRLTTLFAVATALALVAAGCGGDGGDDAAATSASAIETTETTTPAAPSEAEYLKQANAACRKARRGLEKEVKEFVRLRRGNEKAPPLYYAELAHYVFLPKVEDELEAVRALGATPAGEQQKIDSLLYRKELPLNAIAVSKTVKSLEAIDREFVRAEGVLRKSGLASCGRGPEAVAIAGPLIPK